MRKIEIFVFLAVMQSAVTASSSDSATAVELDFTPHYRHCSYKKCPNNCQPIATLTSCRCPSSCSQNCILPSNETLPHHKNHPNPHDPCEIFFCNNGVLSTHITSCKPINCLREQRIRLDGECCESCDPNFSTFCDDEENRECDIACQFAYARDEVRDCDLCRCVRTTTEIFTSTTSTTSTSTTLKPEILEIEENLQFWVIFLMIFVVILSFFCFLTLLIWLVRARLYRRVPLIPQKKQSSSHSVSTTSSHCESV